LWKNSAEGTSDGCEVGLGDSFSGFVLCGQMFQLFGQDLLVVEQVDQIVKTVGDSNQVGAEFATFWIIDVYSREEGLGVRVVEEDIIENSSSNGDLTSGKGGCPDSFPDELDLSSIFC
jgi:hypothetical protein